MLVVAAILSVAGRGIAAPVLLFEPQVTQYQQAVAGVRRSMPDVTDVDPDAPGAALKLGDASVIVAVGRKSLAFARAHAPNQPIVFCMVLGASANDFSTNVTGVPLEPDAKSVLRNVHSLSGKLHRVGLIYNAKTGDELVRVAGMATNALGMTLIPLPITNAEDLKDMGTKFHEMDVLWLSADPKLFSREVFSFLLSLSSEYHVPLIGFLESLTRAGALASVSPDYAENGASGGKLAAEILARPLAKRIPVPGPVYGHGELSINLRTAEALGLSISSNALTGAASVIR